MATKSSIKQRKNNGFDVILKDISKQELYALINAVRLARKCSINAFDLSVVLVSAIEAMTEQELKAELLALITQEFKLIGG